MKKEGWENPALYRKMLKPHASKEAAQINCKGFCDEIRTLREKYKIADVVVMLETSAEVAGEGGETMEVRIVGSQHLGNEVIHDLMLARELGQMQIAKSILLERFKNGQFD